MLLFKIGPLNFDFSSLIALLIGIVLGAAIVGIVYLVMVLNSIKRSRYVVSSNEINVDDEKIKAIIQNAFQEFNDKNMKGKDQIIGYTVEICKSLALDISQCYYPKSKMPYAELTIDEILMLMHYVSLRIDEMFDRPAIRLLKKIKLSTILTAGKTAKKIEDSELMKATKKYKVKKFFQGIMGALNIVNPVYWTKKLIINNALNIATKKLCNVILGIFAEEVYKIYSKRVYSDEHLIEFDIDKYLDDVESGLKDIDEKDIDNYYSGEEDGKENTDEKKKK